MCIMFLYNAYSDTDNDYSIILAANRDEYLDRLSEYMLPWTENINIYGGRDKEPTSLGGTWLALNTAYKKIGVLLNMPDKKKENAVSRGRVVTDYVNSDSATLDYVESLRKYDENCNGFVFVSIEFSNMLPDVKTYSNVSNKIDAWTDACLGFSNSLPNNPLKKVKSGKTAMRDICRRLNKLADKKLLIEELLALLKSKQRHLPDPQLESRQPHAFEQLSSIFVSIPTARYGTRTHTIYILTKTGQIDLIEHTMESPINIESSNWKISEYQVDISKPSTL